jgi:L-fuconolactonase
MIIDAHQHFWQYNPLQQSWINEEMSLIKRDFFPDELKEIYAANQVEGCVAVQADQSIQETSFLLELASQYSFIKGIVGWIDPASKNFRAEIETFTKNPALKGFRNIIQGEPDEIYFTNKAFNEGFSYLQNFHFTYDVLIYHDQLPAAIKFTERYPDQKFILDHCAKPDIRGQSIKNWKRDIRIISGNPNMYCKLSGLVTEGDWKNWTYQEISPYLEIVAEYFGTGRICFGSDWPVCLLAGKYEMILDIIKKFTLQVNEKEREKTFSGNAIYFYQLN